jgi:signal transduction histidine kinase
MRDDGIGFDFSQVEPGHYGLVGMRERVRIAGGQLAVNSQPGKGTNLLITLPLESVIPAGSRNAGGTLA